MHAMRSGRCGRMAPVLFAFYLVANVKVKADGSGKMTIVHPAAPITTLEIERQRYVSRGSEATGLAIRNGLVMARVRFRDVNRLSEAPELAAMKLEMRPGDDGLTRFHGLVRSTIIGDVTSDEDAVIRVTLPGTVVSTNAERVEGRSMTWTKPVKQYFKSEGIELEASFRAPNRTPSVATEGASTASPSL
jgi:hypothetical protein